MLLVPVSTSLVGGTTSTVASSPIVVVVILLEVALRLLVGALCLVDLKVPLVSHVHGACRGVMLTGFTDGTPFRLLVPQIE